MKILTKKQARGLKLNKYYTGKYCAQGHMVERYVVTGRCVACSSIATKRQGVLDKLCLRTTLHFVVHKQDVAAVKEFVRAIKHARKLMI